MAHVIGLLLPLFGATAEAENQVEGRLLLDITGGRQVIQGEIVSSWEELTNQKECGRPQAVFQRRSISVGRGEF